MPTARRCALPILNEETGKTETVSLWGVRVSESVYKSIEADKRDDGIVQRNVVGPQGLRLPRCDLCHAGAGRGGDAVVAP